jgi:hypothetical protein
MRKHPGELAIIDFLTNSFAQKPSLKLSDKTEDSPNLLISTLRMRSSMVPREREFTYALFGLTDEGNVFS